MQILFIKLILFIFRFIPEKLGFSIGYFIGLLWYYVIRYRRNLVIENLTYAFPEKSRAEILLITRQNFIHYGISFIEFLKFPQMTIQKLKSKLTAIDSHKIDNSLKQGRGIIVICGHYGNWDFMSIAQSLLGYDGYIITRRAKNKSIDDFWQKTREDKGVKFLSDRNSIFQIFKLLKKGKIIFIAFDQHMGGKMGVRVNFFNRPASTMRAVALIALKTGVPVIPVFTWREKNKHFFKVGDEIPLKEGFNDEETISNSTQKYNDSLEEFIKTKPDQWLWIHRRWK